jgi:predicted GH43/DUF377 family glycosyl hydrolase
LWFGGNDGTKDHIGYASSIDGKTWIEYENNPVFNPGPAGSWEDESISGPYVLFDGSTYHMWYAGNDGKNTRIGYATSSDGIAWTRYEGNPVMDKGSAGSWESVGVWPDCIYFDGSTYHMWYGGGDGTSIESRIGYATSSDGITWNKYEDNPVLEPDTVTWDQAGRGAPHVLFHDNQYHMWYTGSDVGWLWGLDGVGYATSPDGIEWKKYENNPVIEPDIGEWDSQYAGYTRVLWDSTNAKFQMWYLGGNSDWYAKIGYAIAPIIDGIYDFKLAIFPTKYVLMHNYPNPFNPSTTIEFTLPKSEFVELKIYNILGEEISTLVSKKLNQGNHTYTFVGNNLASGVYYYRLEAGNFVQTRKMIYLK